MQTYNPEPIQDLWIAVLNQAKKDVNSISFFISETAKAWFLDPYKNAGSFLWICDLFNVNLQIIIKQIIQ